MSDATKLYTVPSPSADAEQSTWQEEPTQSDPHSDDTGDEMLISMTTRAMREPNYSREKEELSAKTLAFARQGSSELLRQVHDVKFRLASVMTNEPRAITNKGGEK